MFRDFANASADEARATSFVCDIRFHRSFMLAPNHAHGRSKAIRVSYSDCGRAAEAGDGLDQPVILYASGMFGGRWQGIGYDEIARRSGIRMVSVDRPGIGGTESVALEHRITTWLDIIPALLTHIDVKYVSLMSHSAGVIFNMSVLDSLRQFLHPDRPYAAFVCPWVSPQFSGKKTMQVVNSLPSSWIGSWHRMANFHVNVIAPLVDAARLGFTGLQSISKWPSGSKSPQESSSDSVSDPDQKNVAELDQIVQRLITTYLFAEDITGASQEALLCMGKAQGSWKGIDPVTMQIITAEVLARSNKDPSTAKLRIVLLLAENDEMIGKKGNDYICRCFKRGVDEGVIRLDRFDLLESDHNDVLSPHAGFIDEVFEQVCGRGSGSTPEAPFYTGDRERQDLKEPSQKPEDHTTVADMPGPTAPIVNEVLPGESIQ